MTGRIFNIQPFSIHDGDGLRTVVFLKGCNLRCYWCHNPESHEAEPTIQIFPHKCIGCGECARVCPEGGGKATAIFSEKCTRCLKCVESCWSEARVASGYDITDEELFEKIAKDKQIFQNSGGGVTFSGGEPLLQAEFVAEVMKKCKNEGISTAIETAACVPWQKIEKILDLCDCFICDIKSMDSQKHKEATGVSNELILENIKRLANAGKRLVIHTPVVPTFNDTEDDILQIKAFVDSLGGAVKYELLQFHNICVGKYESMNMDYKAKDLPEPDITELKKLL